MVILKKSRYTTSELIEINQKITESERENYELNNAFWTRSQKDAHLVRVKYHEEVLDLLRAKKLREDKSQSGQLF